MKRRNNEQTTKKEGMVENKLVWCFKQQRGIEFVEPNDNLAQAYMSEANEALEAMRVTKGKWRVVMGYYACYHAVYSLLMKCGVKSEIHDCTIELMLRFGFTTTQKAFMTELKHERINVQYYLKTPVTFDEHAVKKFVEICKAKKMTPDTIAQVREEVKNDKY